MELYLRWEANGNDLDKIYQAHFAIHSAKHTGNEKVMAMTPFSLYNIKQNRVTGWCKQKERPNSSFSTSSALGAPSPKREQFNKVHSPLVATHQNI